MKHVSKVLILGLSILAGLVQAQDMDVRMVAYKDCHSDLNSLEFSNKPQQCALSSQAITFMVHGRNIALIDKDSLSFSKLEVGGKDVRFNRKGENRFELGAFPKIDENGEYAIFDVDLKSAPFGYISSASINGTLGIFTSERLIDETKNGLNLEQGFSLKVGPLTISNQPQQRQSQSGGLGEGISKGLQTAFLGSDKDSLAIFVSGNLDSLVSVEVYEKGQKLNPGWSMTRDNEKKVSFSKPTSSVIDLHVKYWDGLQKITIPLKM